MRGKKDVLKKPSGFADKEGFVYINIPIDEGSGIPESVDVVSESYMDIAQSKNMVRVFQSIASASHGVMINCTAGKDRTGVVCAVLLGLCGVSEDDIVRDYMKTSWSIDIDELRETINRRQKDIVSGKIDLTDLTLN